MRPKPPPTLCPVCAGTVSQDRFGVVACRIDATHILRPWVGESRPIHGSHPRRYYGVAITQHGGWFYSQPCEHEHLAPAQALKCGDRLAREKNRSAGLPWRAPSRRYRI